MTSDGICVCAQCGLCGLHRARAPWQPCPWAIRAHSLPIPSMVFTNALTRLVFPVPAKPLSTYIDSVPGVRMKSHRESMVFAWSVVGMYPKFCKNSSFR